MMNDSAVPRSHANQRSSDADDDRRQPDLRRRCARRTGARRGVGDSEPADGEADEERGGHAEDRRRCRCPRRASCARGRRTRARHAMSARDGDRVRCFTRSPRSSTSHGARRRCSRARGSAARGATARPRAATLPSGQCTCSVRVGRRTSLARPVERARRRSSASSASPSATPSTPASWLSMYTASRPAPVSGSVVASTIELNCLPRRVDTYHSSGPSAVGATSTHGEPGPARSASGSAPPAHRWRPPYCTASPTCSRSSMPAYIGTSVGDLGAQRGGCRPSRSGRPRSGRTRAGELGEDAPLAAGLAERVGDLRAERDLALGRRARAAALLLVAGGRRQQDDVVAVDEHLRRQDDVLVHAQRHVGRARPRRGPGRASPRAGWSRRRTARRGRRVRRPRPSPAPSARRRRGRRSPIARTTSRRARRRPARRRGTRSA